MKNRARKYALAAASGLVPALLLGAGSVNADVRVIETVTGECVYQGGTVEGAAAAIPPGATQTGITCRVYENGVQVGGCHGGLNGPAAACAGPVTSFGPPIVCTSAYAVYPRATVYDNHCN